jgi:NAD(P)-dependent dehydrogenase (short-subunit alcohol dehydrogenase family)
LPPGAEVWITAEDLTLARALERHLGERGLTVRLRATAEVPHLTVPAALGGLVVLAPPGDVTDAWLRDALFAVQRVGPALRKGRGVLATVSHLDGAFGLGGAAPRRAPLDGALAGLAKTAGREWPEVHAKAIDLADGDARALAGELLLAGPPEVGLSATGAVTLDRAPRPPIDAGEMPFGPGDVVVASGGARGVTAEVAVALAAACRATLVLLGRSPPPEPEPAALAALTDEAALKRELGRLHPGAGPRAIGEHYQALLAGREVRRTLERIRAVGGTAHHCCVDIRDPAQVQATLEQVYREHGRVRGLIHGAGVLADARIEDKTPEQFDRVWATKVGGLRNLLAALGPDDLRALVLFSSSTARFGRVGQVDYAMANEALNKLAWQERHRRPGCRVVALDWGPWEGGMVTPALRELFAREGVEVIPLEAGAACLIEELRAGSGPAEVVVLATEVRAAPAAPAVPAPAALPVAFERVLDPAEFPVLAHHVLDGRPVLPVVLMLEWLGHAATVQNPGLKFHGLDELRVLHGAPVEGEPPLLRVGAGKAQRRGGLWVVPTELRSVRQGREVLHARAEVVLAAELPPAPAPAGDPELAPLALTPAEAYEQGVLFHGPELHAIERVEGCGPDGIAGWLRAAPAPSAWLRQPLRPRWLADPLVLDGAFQLLILWSREHRGCANLPCLLGRYRQFRPYPAGGARAVATVRHATDGLARADIDFTDEQGRLVARLEGYECVLDPKLARAFRRNRAASLA